MRKPLLFFAFCMFGNTLQADRLSVDVAPSMNTGWPAQYRHYVIIPNSLSLNQRDAFIYPEYGDLDNNILSPKILLVQLNPFRVIQELPDNCWLYGNWPSYHVIWNKGSTISLFIKGMKWGPENLFLCSNSANIDLVPEIEKLVSPDFIKDKVRHFNNVCDYLIIDSTDHKNPDVEVSSTYSIKGNQIEICAYCSNDPRNLADPWEVRFDGTWNIAQGKFVSYRIHHTPKADLIVF